MRSSFFCLSNNQRTTERRGKVFGPRKDAAASCALFLILASLAAAQPVQTGSYRGGLVSPPLPKPQFVLTDTSGAPYNFWEKTQGTITLLFFGYTNCPDQCPMHMMNIGSALKRLPPGLAGQVKLVFVTTDPERDTPAEMRHWLDNFDKHAVGLTGSGAEIQAVEKAAGVPLAQKTNASSGGYGVAHANFVLAYTKDNHAHVIYPGGVSKDDWVHDLPLLIKETWSRP
jgi:protein SCO1/2